MCVILKIQKLQRGESCHDILEEEEIGFVFSDMFLSGEFGIFSCKKYVNGTRFR